MAGIKDTKIIKGQPHLLTYITPNEVEKLKALGGQKTMTAEGIPAYPEFDNYSGANTPGGAMSRSDFEGGEYQGTGNAGDGVIQQYTGTSKAPKTLIKPKIKKTSAGDADTYWNKFKNKTKSYVNKHNAWSTNKYNQHIIKQNKKALINRLNSYLKLDDDLAFTMDSSNNDIKKAINKLNSKKNLGQFPHSEYPSKTGSAALDFFGKTFGAKVLIKQQIII
jgi:hypothetical protein